MSSTLRWADVPKWQVAGKKLFSRSSFVRSCVDVKDLPVNSLPEIAFAGRSNVGKSSIINALTNNKTLARVSAMPGRTQQLNYFQIADQFYLVDMPGYGYAQAGRREVMGWQNLMKAYLRGRHSLLRLFLLIDSRHGLKKLDEDFMKFLDSAVLFYQIVLTKIDKLNIGEQKAIQEKMAPEIASYQAAHPEILTTSASDNIGIQSLQAEIAALIARSPTKPGY